MKYFIITLILIGLLSSATIVPESEKEFQKSTTNSSFEIAKNWQLLSILALIISSVLVAIGYAVGIGLEIPEITAWANNEFVQIIINALIIVAFLGAMALIESLVITAVASSGLNINECTIGGKSCLQATSIAYLDQYSAAANSTAKKVLTNNVESASWANRRFGIQCLTIFCLQIGTTFTPAGHFILDQDLYSIVFEYCVNLLSSLEAQKFFVSQISFGVGPILLAIGIVGRSFFFSRKLGGLLMSIAAGIMFFFPAMYVFDWMTLDMTVSGDKAFSDEKLLCPSECKISAPVAYLSDGNKIEDPSTLRFIVNDSDKSGGLLNGTNPFTTLSNGLTVYSCFSDADINECPIPCRELPYPNSVSLCSNLTKGVPQACAKVSPLCKISRLVDKTKIDPIESKKCPQSCRIVPPLKSNCDSGKCLESRGDCRVARRTDLNWRPTVPSQVAKEQYERCEMAHDCTASLVANESCVYVVPPTGACSDLCSGCNPECRIEGASLSDLPSICSSQVAACTRCSSTCKVDINSITSLTPAGGMCGGCSATQRILHPNMPQTYREGSCSFENCPGEYRAVLPLNSCDSCLLADEEYSYDPPLNTRCVDLCAPQKNAPLKSASDYTKIDSYGLVGREELKDVSRLMIPAYLLPLFNIVATIIFIKGLSGILGGDIDIPGISRLF